MIILNLRANVTEVVEDVSFYGYVDLAVPNRPAKTFQVLAVRPLSQIEAEFIVWRMRGSGSVEIAELLLEVERNERGKNRRFFKDVENRDKTWPRAEFCVIDFCIDIFTESAAQLSDRRARGTPMVPASVSFDRPIEWKKGAELENMICSYLCS